MIDDSYPGPGIELSGDIVFLVDASASMEPVLAPLRQGLSSFVERLSYPTVDARRSYDLRWRVIGFRDFDFDGDSWWLKSPFVRSPDELRAQLDQLSAAGGGDGPESLLDALFKVASFGNTEKGGAEDPSKWRHRSDARRVVFAFTEGPCKPQMRIPEAAGGDVHDVGARLTHEGVGLALFGPDEEVVRALADPEADWRASRLLPGEPGDNLMSLVNETSFFGEGMPFLLWQALRRFRSCR